MTIKDIISGSLRLLGVIASGETASAAELADGASALQSILESWSNQGLLIPSVTTDVFPLTAGQPTYTIGINDDASTGDFATYRPMIIEHAKYSQITTTTISTPDPVDPILNPPIITYTYAANAEYPITICNDQEWASISDKTLSSSVPTKLYFEETYPFPKIHLWPVPTGAVGLVLYSQKQITRFSTTLDVVKFPPGWSRALRYNLALEIAPEYGKEVGITVATIAGESKAELMRKNTRELLMGSDLTGVVNRKPFNILTGE